MLKKKNDVEKGGEKFDPHVRIGGPFSIGQIFEKYEDLIIPGNDE